MKKEMMNRIEVMGTANLKSSTHVFFLFFLLSLSSTTALSFTPEFPTFIFVSQDVLLSKSRNSLAAKTINTTIGIRKPWSNQMSISLSLESSGSSSWILVYIVYSTRLAVSATVIVALKCFSLINKVISATNTKHIDGMKRDSQNEVLCLVRFITKMTLHC